MLHSSDGLVARKRVLIVDDDNIFCELVVAALSKEGATTIVRNDGADALYFFEQQSCDLAIIDLVMPKIDGLRLIGMLKHMPNAKSVPIVVVTSRTDSAARREANGFGVECFLTKPVQWDQFSRQISDVMSKSLQPLSSIHAV